MSAKTNRFWDRVSRMSRGSASDIRPAARATVEAAFEHLDRDSVVLDLGCGPGDLTLALARGVGSVRGIDPSPGMIGAARARLATHGINNAAFACDDLSMMLDRSGAFNAVTAFNVLPYLDDVGEASRRIAALLTTNGLFLSATACLGERTSLPSLAMRVLTGLRIVPPMHFFTLTELTDRITQGGFRIVETRKLSNLPEYFIVSRKV